MEGSVLQTLQLGIETLERRSKSRVTRYSKVELIDHGIRRFAYGVLELQAIRHSLQLGTISGPRRLPESAQIA